MFILDVNDNAPVFEQPFYTVKVDINVLSDNRTIAIVKAIDRDVDDKLTYTLLNYQHLFEVSRVASRARFGDFVISFLLAQTIHLFR